MKKKIIPVVLFLVGLSASAQVEKYKAFNTFFLIYDTAGAIIDTQDSISVDLLVVMNWPKSKINTYGKREGNMDLIQKLASKIDEYGDRYVRYEGVDQDGEKCMVQWVIYKIPFNGSDGTLSFYYPKPNVSMVYRMKRND